MYVYISLNTQKNLLQAEVVDHKVWIIFVFSPINIHQLSLATDQSCDNFMSTDIWNYMHFETFCYYLGLGNVVDAATIHFSTLIWSNQLHRLMDLM